jgi:hypothetical protein
MTDMAAELADVGEGQLLSELRAGRSSAFALLMRRNNQRLFRLAIEDILLALTASTELPTLALAESELSEEQKISHLDAKYHLFQGDAKYQLNPKGQQR